MPVYKAPLRVGGLLGGSTASEILYTNAANVLSQSSGLQYYDTLPGGATEYALYVNASLTRTVDVGTDTHLIDGTLDINDAVSPGNDGNIAYIVDNKLLKASGSITQNGAIASISYTGQYNSVYNDAFLSVYGDSDLNVVLAGSSNYCNVNQLSVPTAGDAPTITIYGGTFTAQCQVIKDVAATPYIALYGVLSQAQKSGGTTPDVCAGGNFSGAQGTLNYGVIVTGTTAGVLSTGHLLYSVNNTYDLGASATRARKVWSVDGNYSGVFTLSARTASRVAYFSIGGIVTDSSSLTFDGNTLGLPNATTSSTGLLIGAGRVYQDVATSGSGDTLINNRLQLRTANMYINAPVHSSTTASEFGLQVIKTFTPANATSGRCWGLNFQVSATGSVNLTDATSGIVGVEGTVVNNSTGTVSAASGSILFNSLGANSITTRFAGLDIYGADVSGSGGVGATVTEAAGLVVRMGRSSGNTSVGDITSLYGLQLRASTWSGTGHMTTQYGLAYISGHTMNAITANNQTRKFIEIPAMPTPGAFTGTTIYGIYFSGNSGTSRDGIFFNANLGTGVNLYGGSLGLGSALRVGAGQTFFSDTGLYSPLYRPPSSVAVTIRGRDAGDDSTAGGAGTNLTVRAGDGSTSKPTGAGGELIFRNTAGSTTGSMTFYKKDGSTKLQQFNETGIGFFAVAPVAQQTSGANLTNNVTSGGTNDTIADFTDLVIYANDAAAIRNDIYQLSRKLKQVNDALRLYGMLT